MFQLLWSQLKVDSQLDLGHPGAATSAPNIQFPTWEPRYINKSRSHVSDEDLGVERLVDADGLEELDGESEGLAEVSTSGTGNDAALCEKKISDQPSLTQLLAALNY